MSKVGMDIYKALSLKIATSKGEPDVWVRRLVIYKQITPQPVVVREVHLTKGLNIIWAEEPENDSLTAEITGHSAGKTSFCRLIRYVLGEKTFGSKANTELIQKAFPVGYIGAELFVRQKKWAVIRPIGSGRNSYIKADATIEELLPDKSLVAYQDDYPKKLGLDALLDDLDTGAIVRTNDPIQWGHLLGWCSRDQEARFQNIHEWRSPRSESDWPHFRFPKTDPLFVMRTVLGLFLPDELRGEEELADLMRKQETLAKKIEELKREPQFRLNLYDKELRRRLGSIFPNEQELDARPFHWDQLTPDLDRLTEQAAEKIKTDIGVVEDDARKKQDEIDELGAEIQQKSKLLEQTAIAFSFDTAGSREIAEGLSQRGEQLKRIEEFKHQMCPYGGVLISECDYVVRRRDSLQITQLQDARAMEQAEAKRAETLNSLGRQKKQIEDEITQLRNKRSGLQTKRDALVAGIREKRDEARDLKTARDQLSTWMEKSNKPGEFRELDDCQTTLTDTATKIEGLKARLNSMLAQHDSNRELLGSIFSGAVRAVLSSGTYDGRVSLADRELDFRITHGTAMSGEAVETLSVLLADVVCLVYNSVSDKARLPGFLLHDSPREADLGLRIYRSFIRFVAALQKHFGSAEKCPFQYIMTTTTPPPEELRDDKAVKLRLNASVMEEMLFKCSIAAVPKDPDQLTMTNSNGLNQPGGTG